MAALKLCFLVFLCALIVSSKDGYDFCLKMRALKVCECKGGDAYSVICSNVSNSQDLMNSLQFVKNVSIPESDRPKLFTLLNASSLEELPSDLFGRLNIASLTMINVNLNFLVPASKKSPALNALRKSLSFLELYEVRYMENWEWNKLEPMEVSLVKVKNSRFHYIKSSFSKVFVQVRKLYISNSSLYLIESGAIPSKDLEYLDLSENHLTTLSLAAFSEAPIYLETLDLSGNQIESLEEDLLNGMLYLEALFLSDNKLFQVSEKLFEPWKRPTKRRHLCVVFEGTRMNEEDKRVIDVLKSAQYDITVSKDYC